MFIVISLVLFIIIAFAIGVTVFRQTKAIWTMESQNAVTMNSTLNTFTIIEPVLVIIAIILCVITGVTVKAGFR